MGKKPATKGSHVSVIDKGRGGGFTVRVKAKRNSKLSEEELQAHLRVRRSASVGANKKGALKTRGQKHRGRMDD